MQSLFRLINVFYLCASIEASFEFEGLIFSVAFDMHSRQNYIHQNIYIKIVYRNISKYPKITILLIANCLIPTEIEVAYFSNIQKYFTHNLWCYKQNLDVLF